MRPPLQTKIPSVRCVCDRASKILCPPPSRRERLSKYLKRALASHAHSSCPLCSSHFIERGATLVDDFMGWIHIIMAAVQKLPPIH